MTHDISGIHHVTAIGGDPQRAGALPELHGVPVLISAGRLDQIARPEQARTLASTLSDAGAEVTVRWHEAAHTITEGDVAVARGWLGDVALGCGRK